MAVRDRTLVAIRHSLVPLLRLQEDGIAGNIGATAMAMIGLMRTTATSSYSAPSCSKSNSNSSSSSSSNSRETEKSGPNTRHYRNEAMTVALMVMAAVADTEVVIMATLRDRASAERSPATISDLSLG
jgi:hypothetical protein